MIDDDPIAIRATIRRQRRFTTSTRSYFIDPGDGSDDLNRMSLREAAQMLTVERRAIRLERIRVQIRQRQDAQRDAPRSASINCKYSVSYLLNIRSSEYSERSFSFASVAKRSA